MEGAVRAGEDREALRCDVCDHKNGHFVIRIGPPSSLSPFLLPFFPSAVPLFQVTYHRIRLDRCTVLD